MSDLDVEIVPEVDEEDNVHRYYIDKIELAEHRRYICVDMCRLAGSLPDKLVEHAKKLEAFLIGEPEKKAKLKVVTDD